MYVNVTPPAAPPPPPHPPRPLSAFRCCSGLIYALANGVAVGGMGAMMELRYPGIVLNATMLTLGTAFSLFAAFQARVIDVSTSTSSSTSAANSVRLV